ncbi:thioredoxin [Acidomonas methanolica]|nr:thioredoxin [Acidomonas methanolica]
MNRPGTAALANEDPPLMDHIIGPKRDAKPATGFFATDSAPPKSAPPASPAASEALIIDADQHSFMTEVMDASRQLPVLVDFWAPWCGPCRQFTPILEKVVRAARGRVKLVKVDIETNQALAAQLMQVGLPLQSIPMVAAFYKGQIIDLIQGAQPESEVKRFIEALLKMSGGGAMPATDILAAARAALQDSQPEEAAALFGSLLQIEPENPDGWAGMIRAMIALNDVEAAREVISQIPAKIADHTEIAGARAALALHEEGLVAAAALEEVRAQSDADPANHELRFKLAGALNGAGRRAQAAQALLDIIKADRNWNEGAAKTELLRFFDAWGNADSATMPARRKLSAILFS